MLNQPYKTCLLFTLILIVLPFGLDMDTFDVPLHDTYYEFAGRQLGFSLAGIMGFFTLIYWLLRNRRSIKWMTWGHLLPTISLLMFTAIFNMGWFNTLSTDTGFLNWIDLSNILSVLFIMAFVGQIFFILNLILSLKSGPDRT